VNLGFCRHRRACTLEVHGDGVSEVLGNRGGVDSEQDVKAKTMARWRCPKLPGTTVRSDRRLAVVRT
jgi:hypothetical protein